MYLGGRLAGQAGLGAPFNKGAFSGVEGATGLAVAVASSAESAMVKNFILSTIDVVCGLLQR